MDIPTHEELVKQIKTNFWLSGIPYGDSKIYMRFYVLLILLTVMIVAEISFFVSKISSENILELTQLAPCICIGILSVLKIMALAINRSKIFELTECLGRMYNNILNDSNYKELIKHEFIVVKSLTKYFFVLNAVLISVYNFSTLIFIVYHYITHGDIIFSLPYAVLLPFNTDSWLPWAGVYIYSIICGNICVLFFTTIDVLYCVLTTHVCSHFSIISNKIQYLRADSVHRLRDIIKDHQFILKLSEDLEDIFTAPNLFNVLVGSLEICALGFNLTTGNLRQIPGCVLFLLSVLLQILMMSIFGENIIRESRNVGDAAFLCKWYEMDTKSKKTILTIMIRSHKPQKMTASKFSVISYGSFSKIISTSWSYFTILRTVYTHQQLHN